MKSDMKSKEKAQRKMRYVIAEKQHLDRIWGVSRCAGCVFAGFSKVTIGLIVSLLMFAFPVRNASAEQRILAGQEKAAVLAEIVNHFKEFPSISLSFEFKQQQAKFKQRTVKEYMADYFIVLDNQRYYFKGLKKLHTEAELKASPDSVKYIVEKCWNGSIMQIFNHRVGSGSIRAKIKTDGFEQLVFPMFGRGPAGHQSWLKRYQNRGEEYEYEVILDTEKGSIQVVEISNPGHQIHWRQMFEFDRTKRFAITHYYMEHIDKAKNNVERTVEDRFDDFRLVNGFYIPFKVIRKAYNPMFDFHTLQTITVKEAKVNDVSHEEILNGFDFPAGARIYDHILSPDVPIRIGIDEESLESLLKAEVQKARDATK